MPVVMQRNAARGLGGIVALALCALPAPSWAQGDGARPPAPGEVPLARGTFLVAQPELGDGNFARTVVLLLQYGPFLSRCSRHRG